MSFDLLAPYYRWMELLLAGNVMHRSRTAFLDKIPPPRQILLPGEGHGRTLLECRRRFPGARITCVDASNAMLHEARRTLARHHLREAQVQFLQADLLAWVPPAETYDLIITNFVLDCFRPDQLAQIIPRLAASATPEANWLLADFQNPPTGWRGLRARSILTSLYLFFRVTTGLPAQRLTRPDELLQRSGFSLHQRQAQDWGLLHSDWWRK
jgi:ubiquinone/menaquinone biosynthesis C-methylase UbiE